MNRFVIHSSHIRYDFTPELGRVAFQIVCGISWESAPSVTLKDIAQAMTSLLARRSNLSKLLTSLNDLGLLVPDGKGVVLTEFGHPPGAGIIAYENVYWATNHYIYA